LQLLALPGKSFQRQANNYGFSHRGSAYWHELFLRGVPSNLELVKLAPRNCHTAGKPTGKGPKPKNTQPARPFLLPAKRPAEDCEDPALEPPLEPSSPPEHSGEQLDATSISEAASMMTGPFPRRLYELLENVDPAIACWDQARTPPL